MRDDRNPRGPLLVAASNAAVELHRKSFGRGPGAARSHLDEGLLVCVLTDVFTPMEKSLIAAGFGSRVTELRAVHAAVIEHRCRQRMEEVLGCGVEHFTSSVHIEAEIAVDVYTLRSGHE
jgi:uncharacterized protein YbcI